MASDASIYNMLGQGVTPLLNPLDVQAKQIAIRNALAGGQLQDLDIQRQQQAYSDDQATRAAMRSFYAPTQPQTPAAPAAAPAPVVPTPAPGGALPFSLSGGVADPLAQANAGAPAPAPAAAPPVAAPAPAPVPRPAVPTMADLIQRGVAPTQAPALLQSFQKIDETNAQIDQSRAAALKSTKEANDLVRGQAAEMANGMVDYASKNNGVIPPDLIAWHLQNFASLGSQEAAQAQNVVAHLHQLAPADQVAFLKTIANTPKVVEANAKATDAQTAATHLQLETPGLTPNAAGLTPVQQSDHDLRAQEIAKLNSPAELALTASQPGPNQAPAKAALALMMRNNIAERQASQPIINLTPDAKTMLADNYTQTGNMPTIPRGPGGALVAGVLNQAAANNPGVNLGANRADYKANSQSLAALQKQRDVVGAFEQTATKNLDMFLDLAKKLPDTGVPFLNLPLRMVDEKLAGSGNIAAVNAARNVANNEIAKVTTSPGLSGALSDSARHEVEGYNPKDATFAQTLAVARVLRQDMANRPAALDAAINDVKTRMGHGNAPAAAPAGLQHVSTDDLFKMLGAK